MPGQFFCDRFKDISKDIVWSCRSESMHYRFFVHFGKGAMSGDKLLKYIYLPSRLYCKRLSQQGINDGDRLGWAPKCDRSPVYASERMDRRYS
ncbi:hypothetical protein [Scytonema sp. PCC 10023]|uniref:hypothetical protein n=1 Tax=Scytonema sp. PCC 10023 TaxID=1680591 RepID=UPI0039C5B0BA